MNRNELIRYLENKNIGFRLQEHPAAETMEEMLELDLEGKGSIAKNLFVRDDKKRSYYLISLSSAERVDLKALRQIIGSRPLSFASEDDLHKKLKLNKGSVTPFGLLNDRSASVIWLADISFKDAEIAVHPMENTAMVWLKTADLQKLLEENGTEVRYIQTRQIL